MWIRGAATLDVWEFYSTHVATPHTKVVPGVTASGALRKGIKARHSLKVGPLKMTAALARSGATLSPNEAAGFWRALGAVARFQEACTISNGQMMATAGLLDLLRDSTRTALAGDLGQAFSWLLAIEHFKNSAVVDFGRGCSLLSPGVPSPGLNVSRPDFMASSAPWAKISLFESKGTIRTSLDDVDWRDGLVGGLAQTKSGATWLANHNYAGAVSQQLAVVFALIEGSSSAAAFADPEDSTPDELPASTRLALVRAHFGAWAAAGGSLDLAADLWNPTVESSSLRERIEWLEEVSFRERPMLLIPETPPGLSLSPFGPTLHLVDAAALRALGAGDLSEVSECIETFRRAFEGPPHTDLEGVPEKADRSLPESAVFADGTVYASWDDPAVR